MSDEDLREFFDNVGTQSSDGRGRDPWNAGQTSAYPIPSPSPSSAPSGPISAWAISGDRYWGISQSLDRLPSGCYKGEQAPDVGVFLSKQPIRTDALLTLPDSKGEAIVAEIAHFTTLRPAFASRGLLYKRGVLLWGPPGSGKTSTLHLLMRLIVDRCDGIALLIDQPYVAASAMQLIRKIEPERQVIGILEDIDGLIATHGVEQYLSLLDGETQIDNVVFVATTNYPERLDKRLVDRPSRFDTVEYVGMPTADARRAYLTHKEPLLASQTIEALVQASEGLSIAHLRELIILTQCFGRPIEDSAKRMTAHRRRPPSSERSPEAVAAGFGASRW